MDPKLQKKLDGIKDAMEDRYAHVCPDESTSCLAIGSGSLVKILDLIK